MINEFFCHSHQDTLKNRASPNGSQQNFQSQVSMLYHWIIVKEITIQQKVGSCRIKKGLGPGLALILFPEYFTPAKMKKSPEHMFVATC